MRVVFLLVFLMAWPGGVTSNPLPDVDAEEFGRSGLSTSQGIDGVVGQTLEGYQGSTGANENGKGQTEDGVVAGRSRRLSSSDGESADVPMPKAVVDTKSFEVSSGNDAQVNILAGSKVVIKINPSPFESVTDHSSNPNKLKMDLICDGNGGGDSAEFGFYRDDYAFTAKINVGSSSFVCEQQTAAAFLDIIFENGKVTSSKINTAFKQVPIPFTAPKCLKNSDGKDVWRAKFSTADSRVKFKVEIENTVVSAGSVTAIGEKSGDKTAAAGVRWWGWAMIAVAITGAIVGGLVALYFCYFKKKDAKVEQDKTEAGSGGEDGDDDEDSKDSKKSTKSKKKKKGGKKGKKKGNKANANAAAGAGGANQANPNGQAAAAPAAAPAAGPYAGAPANGQAANNGPAKFGNKVGVAAAV